MQGANRWPMYAEYGSITVGVGFEISVKFLQSFSETEILRKFHEIYDFSEIYDFRRQRSSARAVPEI